MRFTASRSSGQVSALLVRPPDARRLLALAHGAGAGMRHPFLHAVSSALADRGIASLRYQFPYLEKGSRRPDPQPILTATVRAALVAAREAAPDLPLLAGGKSMGGRMTSLALAGRDGSAEDTATNPPDEAATTHPEVHGLVFLGFPLHPAGRPAADRAEHLQRVAIPMLFLQGTRDSLADLELLRPVCRRLGRRATLQVVEGADHSFHVRRATVPVAGTRSDADVVAELADAILAWSERLS
jgi:predicted alpha/beta-hydrolase family hydrolase